MEASIESIEDGVTPGSQIVYGTDGAPKPPAQRCLKVTIDVLDGGGAFRAAGAPVTDLQPYLMAAAHIFIVPTDAIESYETGGSRHELVTHAHAYATELAPITSGFTGLRLEECEDWSKMKYPMDPAPERFGPNLYSLLITAYLRPAEGEPMLRELHDLLQTERARLDPVEVMSALPTGAAAHPHRWQHSTHRATLATHRATLCRARTLPPAVGGCRVGPGPDPCMRMQGGTSTMGV